MQLVFTVVGAWFFWLMLAEPTLMARLDNIAVLIFCLWRIDRQRDIICYVTEKGLIVRRQFMSLQEFTDEQITKMNYYDRRAALIAELNKNLVKNRETDDYDYIDLKGINDVLHPLKCKYKITDMPCKEDNGDMSLIMIDSLTGEKHGKITIPWPGNDDEHNNNMRKIQITGANITYLRRYLLMLAYDISVPKDFYDENKTPLKFNDIPEALRPKESVKDGQKENKKSSDLDPVSKEKYFGTEKKDLVPYETGEEELQILIVDVERQKTSMMMLKTIW